MMQLIGAERTKMKKMLLPKQQQQPQVATVTVESTSGSGHPGIIVTTPRVQLIGHARKNM
eukprot:COSAG05_NODE_16706_length_340_cov_1.078838_1_plen_60_part_00